MPIPTTQAHSRRNETLVKVRVSAVDVSKSSLIEAGDSDPHYDDQESCASDGSSTRQQSQQKSVQLSKKNRTFQPGTTLNCKV